MVQLLITFSNYFFDIVVTLAALNGSKMLWLELLLALPKSLAVTRIFFFMVYLRHYFNTSPLRRCNCWPLGGLVTAAKLRKLSNNRA
jgi:hypothetical protein